MMARPLASFPLMAACAVAATLRADETGLPVGGLGGTTLGGHVVTSASFPAGAAVPEPDRMTLATAGAVVLLIAGARGRRR